MNTRRKFLQQSGALLLAGGLLSRYSFASFLKHPQTKPIGLQLFTLFNTIDSDVEGSLKKVADIGFKEIESAFSKKGGYYGLKPKEFNSLLNGLGLSWKSHHVLGAPFKLPPGSKMPTGPDGKPITIPPMRNLRENYQQLIDEAAEGGVQYLVCATTPVSTTEEIKSSIEVLNKSAEAAKKAGLQLAYHNHHQEFAVVDGKVPYDLLLSETNPDALKMELDLAWAIKGGADPVALFKKNPGRFPLWHVKDLDAQRETILPVGSGTIDFKPIFANAGIAGMQHFFVEHDMPADAFASIISSYSYLSKMLSA